MTIEKIDKQLAALQNRKDQVISETDKKMGDLRKKRELEISSRAGRIFAKHKITPDELKKLQKASKDDLKRIFEMIGKGENSAAKEEYTPAFKKET